MSRALTQFTVTVDGPFGENPRYGIVCDWVEQVTGGPPLKGQTTLSGEDARTVLALAPGHLISNAEDAPVMALFTAIANIAEGSSRTQRPVEVRLRLVDATTATPVEAATLTINDKKSGKQAFVGAVPAADADGYATIQVQVGTGMELFVSAPGYAQLVANVPATRRRDLTLRLTPVPA
jgi:hypothetical protein